MKSRMSGGEGTRERNNKRAEINEIENKYSIEPLP